MVFESVDAVFDGVAVSVDLGSNAGGRPPQWPRFGGSCFLVESTDPQPRDDPREYVLLHVLTRCRVVGLDEELTVREAQDIGDPHIDPFLPRQRLELEEPTLERIGLI
ncbi:hypothetical protein AB0H98_27840 [Nocardia salmonicida]|uniref:hypothetical protein n=1 Tax=Nocardia salmonicida TaxID=53431 RepID=UPI0033FF6623